MRIEAAPGGVGVEPGDAAVAGPVRRFLGASFDLAGFADFAAARDRTLAALVSSLRGFRPPLAPDPFEALVTSITAQQVSLRAAFAIRNRLIEGFSDARQNAFSFPRRETLAAAAPGDLAGFGFSRRKAEYVLALARSDLDLDGLAALPDDAVRTKLRALPGIGEWTAEWFLARHLGRPDAWPAGDLGLRKAVSRFYFEGRLVSAEDVRAFGARFSPFRNLAAHYLLVAMRVSRS